MAESKELPEVEEVGSRETEGPQDSGPANVARFGAFMVACLTLSRVLGYLRDTAVSYQFGINDHTDAYRIAISLPDLIFMLIAGGGLSSAFIPVFSDLIHRGKEREAWKAFSVAVTTISIGAIILISAVWLAAPVFVGYFAQGQKNFNAVVPEAIPLSRILLPAQFAFLVGSILIATLYSRQRFAAPGLAPNVYNLGIIAGALVLPPLFGLGMEGLAWGALCGAILGNLVIPSVAMVKAGSHFKPSLDLRAEGVAKFYRLLLPVILGFSLPSMVNLITRKFTSLYGGDGLVTSVDYANNLMQAPLGIFGQALALAVFPILAEFVAKNRMDRYRDQISLTLRTVTYLGMPSGALMLALAPHIANVLYGYGRASHNKEGLQAIGTCLQVYSVGIFAWCMQPVLMRGFFSLHKTFKPIAISTGLTVVFILLCVAAQRIAPTNYLLLPASTDVAAILLAISLFFALEHDVGRLDRPKIVATLLLSAVAASFAGAAVYGLSRLLGRFAPRRFEEVLLLLGCGLVGAWVYYLVTSWMRMPETDYVDRMVRRAQARFVR